jgi:BolA protein
MGRVKAEIERRLQAALAPERLFVRDDSEQHIGHAGHRPGGETHFFVEVVSPRFRGQARVARQRLVFAALDDLMREQIHAISIKALAPDEAIAND